MSTRLMATAISLPRLEGNLAKQRVQRRLRELLADASDLSILDVGCVGPSPLEMWRWIFDDFAGRFHLTGTDVAGIERAQHVAEQRGWTDTRFVQTGAYDLSQTLAGERFDVVVCTQVLEHVRDVPRFAAEIARAMKPGARALLTLDSGHFRRGKPPLRAAAKWVVVRLGRERYHELGLRDEEVERAFGAQGLSVVDRKYFNLHPLKWVHNHGLPAEARDRFAEQWYELELTLNADEPFIRENKHLFQGLYYELRAP